MKYVFLYILLFATSVTVASEGSELNKTMKEMGHSYKQMMTSADIGDMRQALSEFKNLVNKSKQLGFANKHQEESQQGLDKVLDVINKAEVKLAEGKLSQAKLLLADIDTLRKRYHELHEPPSIWQLLFGS
ncbi:cytochrome b562 (plasmid) [Pseudoalteromonas sp. T1lg65]|uniref:cytochrome b562 n=1 Tax=Pseudoalteromonas sp. T1lg65 TaxID=2077101 RepID=UPI003F7A1BC6